MTTLLADIHGTHMSREVSRGSHAHVNSRVAARSFGDTLQGVESPRLQRGDDVDPTRADAVREQQDKQANRKEARPARESESPPRETTTQKQASDDDHVSNTPTSEDPPSDAAAVTRASSTDASDVTETSTALAPKSVAPANSESDSNSSESNVSQPNIAGPHSSGSGQGTGQSSMHLSSHASTAFHAAGSASTSPGTTQPAFNVEGVTTTSATTPMSVTVTETGVAPQTASSGQTPTAPSGSTTELPHPTTAQDAQNVSRVARGLSGAVHQHGGTVTLRMHPPELGFVRVEMQMNQGVVRAQLTAETDAVRSLLQHQVGHLREALHSHGLTVEQLDVRTLDPNPGAHRFNQQHDQSAADGRSRGRMQDDQANHEQDTNDRGDDPSAFGQALVNAVA